MIKDTKSKEEGDTKATSRQHTSVSSKGKKAINPQKTAKNPFQIVALTVSLIAGITLIGLYFLLTSENNSQNTSNVALEEETITTNCEITACLEQITTDDSVESITEVIGVEPEVDEATGTAKWRFSGKESLAREKSGSGYILQATIDKTKIASQDVDFSVFSDLKRQLESGESFTYDELVERLGGVAGTLAGKTNTSKRYIWVDQHDQTFSATFSDKTGECTIISLR